MLQACPYPVCPKTQSAVRAGGQTPSWDWGPLASSPPFPKLWGRRAGKWRRGLPSRPHPEGDESCRVPSESAGCLVGPDGRDPHPPGFQRHRIRPDLGLRRPCKEDKRRPELFWMHSLGAL